MTLRSSLPYRAVFLETTLGSTQVHSLELSKQEIDSGLFHPAPRIPSSMPERGGFWEMQSQPIGRAASRLGKVRPRETQDVAPTPFLQVRPSPTSKLPNQPDTHCSSYGESETCRTDAWKSCITSCGSRQGQRGVGGQHIQGLHRNPLPDTHPAHLPTQEQALT